jgi:hypothetical protein
LILKGYYGKGIYYFRIFTASNILFLLAMSTKRSRNTLLPNWRDNDSSPQTCTESESSKSNWYLETKGVPVDNKKVLHVHERTQKARLRQYDHGTSSANIYSNPEDSEEHSMLPGMSAARKTAIKYVFCQIYKSPPKDEWADCDVINDIMARY